MTAIFRDSARDAFGDDWWFVAPSGDAAWIDPARMPTNARSVQLPHAWNEQGWSYEPARVLEPRGTGWYFKVLPASAETSVTFEGIAAASEIFLNGRKIAEHIGAHLVFDVSLKDARGDGADVLAIKVTDKPSVPLLSCADDEFSASPRYKRWAFPMGSSLAAGGIWRDVWLYRTEERCIDVPRIENSATSIRIVAASRMPHADVRLRYDLFDPSGTRVAGRQANAAEWVELQPDDIQLWWPLEPKVYRLESTAMLDGRAIQTISQPVTFFEIGIRDSEFYVNHRPYFLRGQNGFPHCNVMHDAEYIRRYVSRICDQGVEISRFHTEPPSHAWLDECDRQGIMVIFEMAAHGSMGCYAFGHPAFQKAYTEELRSLVEEYRRHPSIVMWCLGNELIVDCERRLGLGNALFDILDGWVQQVRSLDSRPVIANSGGDAAELVAKTVGDVDDIHQYGGWYTETLCDLRNHEKFIRKNDCLFSPTICTESVAAYTDNAGRFFLNHKDARQEKVVRQRMGRLDAVTPERSMAMQAFILKEYAEAMWRMRRDDTTLAGYIPFGQYTWFFDPFDAGPHGLGDKPVWQTYRRVLSPVHVQLECWDRHVCAGATVIGRLILNHEDRRLPRHAECVVTIASAGTMLFRQTMSVSYHSRMCADIELDTRQFPVGRHRLDITVHCHGRCVSENDRDIVVYPRVEVKCEKPVWVYDPLKWIAPSVGGCREILRIDKDFLADSGGVLIIGPHAMDAQTQRHSALIRQWCDRGNACLVMEQLPSLYTRNMLESGIGVKRCRQPYWSRWATNMVRHADRADICRDGHAVFSQLDEEDLAWWNGDTFLAHAYFHVDGSAAACTVLSGVGQGLADDELMPVEHPACEPQYDPLMIESRCGAGRVVFSNLLMGTKLDSEPVARMLLANILTYLQT